MFELKEKVNDTEYLLSFSFTYIKIKTELLSSYEQ